MAQRLDLQAILVELLGTGNVYFQPPASISMSYPCIVYKRDNLISKPADNFPYLRKKRYQITVIDSDPDSEIPDKVSNLPACSFDRFFTADNLNHDVFSLFF
jgi:hypothetical protein